MTNLLVPFLKQWPLKLATHFCYRSVERGFDQEWIPLIFEGTWRPISGNPFRFLVEIRVNPDDRWRLVVDVLNDPDVLALVTVFPTSAAKTSA